MDDASSLCEDLQKDKSKKMEAKLYKQLNWNNWT